MTDRETARDLSRRLEKAQEEIAELKAYIKQISYIALSHGVISRGLFTAANGINRADIDDFVQGIEKEATP
jgi:broad specificity phosphatase PhoE